MFAVPRAFLAQFVENVEEASEGFHLFLSGMCHKYSFLCQFPCKITYFFAKWNLLRGYSSPTPVLRRLLRNGICFGDIPVPHLFFVGNFRRIFHLVRHIAEEVQPSLFLQFVNAEGMSGDNAGGSLVVIVEAIVIAVLHEETDGLVVFAFLCQDGHEIVVRAGQSVAVPVKSMSRSSVVPPLVTYSLS